MLASLPSDVPNATRFRPRHAWEFALAGGSPSVSGTALAIEQEQMLTTRYRAGYRRVNLTVKRRSGPCGRSNVSPRLTPFDDRHPPLPGHGEVPHVEWHGKQRRVSDDTMAGRHILGVAATLDESFAHTGFHRLQDDFRDIPSTDRTRWSALRASNRVSPSGSSWGRRQILGTLQIDYHLWLAPFGETRRMALPPSDTDVVSRPGHAGRRPAHLTERHGHSPSTSMRLIAESA